jgi:short-subunit dehydrogenase
MATTAVVTGASSGIGGSYAEHLAAKGMNPSAYRSPSESPG